MPLLGDDLSPPMNRRATSVRLEEERAGERIRVRQCDTLILQQLRRASGACRI